MLIPWRVCILHRYLQTLQSRGVPMVQDGDEANAPGGVPVAFLRGFPVGKWFGPRQ